MEVRKVICVLVLLATNPFVSAEEIAQNSSESALAEEQFSSVSQKGNVNSNIHSSLSQWDFCGKKCNWWYSASCRRKYCRKGVCCTPGSVDSRCCSLRKPVCAGKGKCCSKKYPKLCGDQRCCKTNQYCCQGEFCCKSAKACCGDRCCKDQFPCCKREGSTTCCNEATKGCCEGYGCVDPCQSQFDAFPCELTGLSIPSGTSRSTRAIGDKLYRVLRPGENPQGIVAKNPSATRTVRSHVICGSRRNYASQYISTSTSLDVVRAYKTQGEAKSLIGLRICEFDVNQLRNRGCRFFDLTDVANQDKYLGSAVLARNFARASKEVVLKCDQAVPCTVIDPPSRG